MAAHPDRTFSEDERISKLSSVPFLLMHLAPLGALWTGANPVDWLVCLALYYVRMVGITAGFHRLLSHRSFKATRFTQFMLVAIGASSAQKGPLWWAAHHRHHHKHSDDPEDIHSPRRGFWWSHMGWTVCRKYDDRRDEKIPDLLAVPELVWLDRYWLIPPTLLAVGCLLAGGWSMLFIGFFLSTALLYHGTFTINSLSHVFGTRRFKTGDDSRNNWLLALLTCGEGWHNNHHHYQSSANQGFYWWELDVSYYIIRGLQLLGQTWDVRKPTPAALASNRLDVADARGEEQRGSVMAMPSRRVSRPAA